MAGQINGIKSHCRLLNSAIASGTGQRGNHFLVGQEVTTLLSSFNSLYLQISMSGHWLSWDINPCCDLVHPGLILLCFFIWHNLLGEV